MNLSKLLDLPTKMDNESHCIVLLFIEVIWDILKSDSWRNFSLVVENQPWLCEFLAHSPDWKKFWSLTSHHPMVSSPITRNRKCIKMIIRNIVSHSILLCQNTTKTNWLLKLPLSLTVIALPSLSCVFTS